MGEVHCALTIENNNRIEHEGFNLEAALNWLALSLYTDDWTEKVLAFVNALKGKDEEVTTNPGFHFAIQCSFSKLYRNGRLNPAMLDLFQYYPEELSEKGLETPWLKDIKKRYGLKNWPVMWKKCEEIVDIIPMDLF